MKTAHEFFFFKLNCIFHFNLLDLIKKIFKQQYLYRVTVYILLSKGFENVSNFHNACT